MATDYFLKISGIEGESPDEKHTNEIELLSWDWGAEQHGSFEKGTLGPSGGRVDMRDFRFSMRTSKASPKLMEYCAKGEAIDEALLTCRKAGGDQQEYMKIKFKNLIISSFETGGAQGDELPTDQISFNYATINIEYQAQDEKGKLTGKVAAGWDRQKNKPV